MSDDNFRVDFSQGYRVILYRGSDDGNSRRIDLTNAQAITLAKAILLKLEPAALERLK